MNCFQFEAGRLEKYLKNYYFVITSVEKGFVVALCKYLKTNLSVFCSKLVFVVPRK